MKNTIFDIIGPIMIGPSSSHTAGAVKLGNIANKIANEKILEAKFLLHGSFKNTYKGHGTDKALVGGLIGYELDNEKIKSSMKRADFEYSFKGVDLKNTHPNTVILNLTLVSGAKISIQGSSVGGGKVKINKINNLALSFDNEDNLIIFKETVPRIIEELKELNYIEKKFENTEIKVFILNKKLSKDMIEKLNLIKNIIYIEGDF